MIAAHPSIPALVAGAITAAGLAQSLVGLRAVRRFRAAPRIAGQRPPMTVLKPLHGDEPLLEEALASFCTQDYPCFQLVFGVQDAADAAVAVVERLRVRFPAVDMELVIDPTPHGLNRKIANLINMFPSARHSTLVISDSDMHAAPDLLRSVADALAVPGTGLVTSLYTGRPARPGLAGQLGAANINQTFAAGALMARDLGRQDCMGATMALTRETLMRLGGFPALSPFVADDAVLGAKVRGLGQKVTLAASVPATTVADQGLAALFRHELRWARTIRAVEPLGFALSAVQFPGFWALLTYLLSGGAAWAAALWVAAIGVRATTGRVVERKLRATPTWFLLPALRDVFSIAVMLAAYTGGGVSWRGHAMTIADDTEIFAASRPLLVPPRG